MEKYYAREVIRITFEIFQAFPGGAMIEREELEDFLRGGRHILTLATLDKNGGIDLSPVWYLYEGGKIFILTRENSTKAKNAAENPEVVFCVDLRQQPYKGAVGRGRAELSHDPERIGDVRAKILKRYVGDPESDLAKRYLKTTNAPRGVLLEIIPESISTWDFGKESH